MKLLSLLADETRTVGFTVEVNGEPVTIDYRIRMPDSATAGRLLATPIEAPTPETPAQAQARAAARLEAMLPLVCGSVTHVRIGGGDWDPITLTLDGEPDDATGRCPVLALGIVRVTKLAAAIGEMVAGGGPGLASFLGRGLAAP